MKNKVCIGIVGAGYASILHCEGYQRVHGAEIILKTISDVSEERAKQIKNKFNFITYTTDYEEMLKDDEIDVIDICTPPMLHKEMIIKALKAGKHVICEKPLLGYFGKEGDIAPIGRNVSKEKMYQTVLEELNELEEIVKASDKNLMYAENFVYAPNIQKALEIMKAKNSKLLFLKGEESLRGSSSSTAGEWAGTGGGSLMRVGCHPLTGILYLKEEEAKYRNTTIEIESVTADVGQITSRVNSEELKYHTIKTNDVEDFANITITFTDGSKAIVMASDTVLGGTKNYIEIYTNNTSFICNLTPIDTLNVYMLDDNGMENIKFSEMLPTAIGWNKAFVSDEVIRGYTDELQDFINAIVEKRQAYSNFKIAADTIRVIYAAYVSAETGKKYIFN